MEDRHSCLSSIHAALADLRVASFISGSAISHQAVARTPEMQLPMGERPYETRNATASITYGFPSWVGDRRVALFLDGNYYTDALVGTASGTMNVAISTACFRREVTHTYEAIATSCSRWNDPNYVATDTKSLSVSTEASVPLAVTAPDPDGNVPATIGYSFPNTNSSSQRAVALFIDGVQRFFDTRQDQNGTWT